MNELLPNTYCHAARGHPLHGPYHDCAWLDKHHPRSREDWVKLFKRHFRFTGGEITGEYLLSTGHLEGAHHPCCPVYETVRRLDPPWTRVRHA